MRALALPTQIEKAIRRPAMTERPAKARPAAFVVAADFENEIEMSRVGGCPNARVHFSLGVLQAEPHGFVQRRAGLHTVVDQTEAYQSPCSRALRHAGNL